MTMQTNNLAVTEPSYACEEEQRVARVLDDAGIRYQYRPTVLLPEKDAQSNWCPSFSVPAYGLYIEYVEQTHHQPDEPLEKSVVQLSASDLQGNYQATLLNRMYHLLKQRTADLEFRINQSHNKNSVAGGYDFDRYYPQYSVMETVYGPRSER